MNNTVAWCFFLYVVFYIPLIYLSNSSVDDIFKQNADIWGKPLAILPVSTALSCIAASLITVFTGWWKTWIEDKQAAKAALQASPFTACVLSFVPLAYAIAPPNAILSTLSTMKAGSLLVSVPKAITGASASTRIKISVGACIVAILMGVLGKLFDIHDHKLVWKGVVIGFSIAGQIIALLYMGAYSGRLHFMATHKKSVAFFSLEHLAAPFIAILIMALASPFVPALALGFKLWGNWKLWALGGCSQIVGLAGGWILVGRQLSSVAMVLNRSAAVLAGVTLTLFQSYQKGFNAHTIFELLSAGVVLSVLATLPSDKQAPTFASIR